MREDTKVRKPLVGISVVLAAAAMIFGAALADENDKFVVRGDSTKGILEQNSINVDTAERIAKACVDAASQQGVRVSIAILDQFGVPVYSYRMDGQRTVAVETAMMKAKTVINTRLPSKAAAITVAQGASSEARQTMLGNFPVAGGLPIIVNGNQLIGAIGVGGSMPRLPVFSDEICAWRALTAVMGKQPDLLPDPPAPDVPGGSRKE